MSDSPGKIPEAPAQPSSTAAPNPPPNADFADPNARPSSAAAKSAAAPTPDLEEAPLSIEMASISDTPTLDDELGFEPYVVALAKFLLSNHTSGPLTLSIEGEWGSGKSSFMKQLEEFVVAPTSEVLAKGQKAPLTRTFWFNAWRQDKQEAVWAAFALAFGRELRRLSPNPWNASLRLARQRAQSNPDQSGLAKASIKTMAWIAGIIFCYVALHSLGAHWLKWLLSGTVSLAAMVQAYKGIKEVFGSPFETHIADYLRGPDYAQRVAFVEQFHEDFTRMLDAYAGGVDKIFVFIDDLDRCEVPKAAELMQAFNLLIGDDKRLIFIIGMDREKVAAGIAAKYKDLAPFLYGDDVARRVDYGFSFLEKFIQLPFQVPLPNVSRLDNFLEKISTQPVSTSADSSATPARGGSPKVNAPSQAAAPAVTPAPPPTPTQLKIERDLELTGDSPQVRAVAKMFASTVQRSPRKLKQFINVFRLKAHIANQLALFDDGDNGRPRLTFEQLGKFVAITLAWPKLISALSADASLIPTLEQAALAGSDSATGKSLIAKLKDPLWAQIPQLSALLQYGCISSKGSPFAPDSYSLVNVDLAPLLEISPQIVHAPRKKPQETAAAAVAAGSVSDNAQARTSPAPDGSAAQPLNANPDKLNDSGVEQEEHGRFDQAIALYQQALELRPDDGMILFNLANALAEIGRTNEAIAAYQKAVHLRPDDPDIRYNLASTLAEAGHLQVAIDAYEQALKLRPNDPDILINLGVVHAEAGGLQAAVKQYSQALSLRPEDPDALNNMGSVLERMGRTKEAIAYYRRALSARPDDDEIAGNLNAAEARISGSSSRSAAR